MPDVTFADGATYTAANLNSYLFHQTVVKCLSTNKPASPATGMTIFETDTGLKKLYTGSIWSEVAKMNGWKSHTPVWSSTGTAPVLNNGTSTMKYHRLYGRTYIIKGILNIGTSSTFGTGSFTLSLPSEIGVAASDAIAKSIMRPNANVYLTETVVAGGLNYILFRTYNAPSNSDLVYVSGTVPEAWVAANAGIIQYSIIVEGNTDA